MAVAAETVFLFVLSKGAPNSERSERILQFFNSFEVSVVSITNSQKHEQGGSRPIATRAGACGDATGRVPPDVDVTGRIPPDTDATGRVPPVRKHPSRNSIYDTRQQGDYSFRYGGYEQAAMRIGRWQGAIGHFGRVAEDQRLDRGKLRDHAGSHPLFLCADGISAVRFSCLDGVLEAYGVESLSASARPAALAEGLLGHAAALRRELCRQMGVCPRQSRAQGVGGECGFVAVSRRDECSQVAR